MQRVTEAPQQFHLPSEKLEHRIHLPTRLESYANESQTNHVSPHEGERKRREIRDNARAPGPAESSNRSVSAGSSKIYEDGSLLG